MKTRLIPDLRSRPHLTIRLISRRGSARCAAWLVCGLSSRAAVDRYLPNARGIGASARGLIGSIRRQLIEFAQQRQRADLVYFSSTPPTTGCSTVRSRTRSSSCALSLFRSRRSPTTSACG